MVRKDSRRARSHDPQSANRRDKVENIVRLYDAQARLVGRSSVGASDRPILRLQDRRKTRLARIRSYAGTTHCIADRRRVRASRPADNKPSQLGSGEVVTVVVAALAEAAAVAAPLARLSITPVATDCVRSDAASSEIATLDDDMPPAVASSADATADSRRFESTDRLAANVTWLGV